MDIAIVTGASSSLGIAISSRLIQLGFRVYGLGGDYTDCPLQNVNFKPFNCDLTNPNAVEAAAKQIVEKEKGVYLIVNNAKFFGRNAFLEMDTAEVENILRINLLCPLILVKTLASSLKELGGYVIQLGTPHAETSRGGPAGAAASGGLKWMGEVLFHELRSHGVRVCHLSPEPNRARASERRVRRGARTEATIDPEAVAQAVEQMLQSPFGNVITEMILRPLRVSEPDQEPVLKLPYPEPQPIPYTVPREYIEAEEQLEDDEINEAEKKRARSRSRKKPVDVEASPEAAEKSESTEKSNRVEKPNRERRPSRRTPRSSRAKQDKRTEDKNLADKPNREVRITPEPTPDEKPKDEAPKRRRRRKPKPPTVAVGFHKPEPAIEKTTPEERKPEKTERSRKPKQQREPAKPKQERDQDKPNTRPARKAAKKVGGKSRDAVGKEQSSERLSPREEKIAKKIAVKAAEAGTETSPDKPAKKAVKKAVKKAAKKAVKRVAKKAVKKATEKAAPTEEKPVKKTPKKAVKKAARKQASKKTSPTE